MSATTAGTHLVAGFPLVRTSGCCPGSAAMRGDRLPALLLLHRDGPVPALVLGFGATPPEQAVLGVRGIAAAFERSACADGPGHGLDG
ncbi:hypothetical protein F3K37_43095 [Streptomyces sp. LBUM 1477]|nr:hypothetical protein [Streptomyces sp. LBUM 1477]MBP5880848.1 hypothetical protein [Streptomyces sp. LBUM 1477]